MNDIRSSRSALASQINALRTHLTVAIGRTQLLRRGLASEPAATDLDGRLAAIEGDLFRLARIADRIENLSAPPPAGTRPGGAATGREEGR